MTSYAWQKSSYCPQGEACLHAAATADGNIALTESDDPTGSIVTTTPARFRALLDSVRAGGPFTYDEIEVLPGPDGVVRLRDVDGGAVVTTSRANWGAFARGARDGEFDHLVRIRPRQFHEAAGTEDWRVLGEGACAYFRTGSFAAGVRFVQAIGERVGEGPDIDLRAEGVTVRLITLTAEYYGMTERHVTLAREISAVAHELGLTADPSAVQTVQVTVDALAIEKVTPFWRALLGYEERAGSVEDLVDPQGRGAPFYFQEMDAARPQRNRVHVDVWVPYDRAQARIAAAIAAGGTLVTDEHAPGHWVLADPEGNEACVGTTGG
ncbi:VOC family protein [Streptomyces sp. NPDC048629]|uniref:VOC family protein n=1 Tax=Streptomyces sp. NPDC048629 TaxID=3154824 RepID=UPI0034369BE9